MDTYTLELTLEIDREDWARFAGCPASEAEVREWVVEVLSISQGHAAGAVTVRNVR